jgi:hypothetical protein
MSDIVQRLRLRRDPLTDGERAEAADKIERLREENLGYYIALTAIANGGGGADELRRIAREAIGDE